MKKPRSTLGSLSSLATLATLAILACALLTRSAQAQSAAATLAEAPPSAQTLSLGTDRWHARVSAANGGITSFQLLDKAYEVDGKPYDVVTTEKPQYLPLVVHVDGIATAALTAASWHPETLSDRAVRLRTIVDGIGIERKLEAGNGPYQLWVTTTLGNRGDKPRKLALREATYHYVARKAENGAISFLPARSSAHSSVLCHHGEDLERIDHVKLSQPKSWSGDVRFAAVENVYFLNAIVGEGAGSRACTLSSEDRGIDDGGKPLGALLRAELAYPTVTLQPGEHITLHALAYLGPKTPSELAVAGHSLRESINAGFFTKLSDGLTLLLGIIHSGIGNWGLAIILLTFFVKLVLYPLTHKQMESMAKMKELKPEMDKLNALYADDREKKGAAVMELYRKKGVNPMAGCLPVLLQLPIWFSLYASLSSNIHLFHAPFALWWRDLSSPDPFFVLPLALGVLMFVQQKLTPPAGADPMQQKMMLYMMPTMITSFMLFLPAGLCLYMFTNSALSIAQQKFIESRLRNAVSAAAATTESLPSDSGDAQQGNPKHAERRLRRGRK